MYKRSCTASPCPTEFNPQFGTCWLAQLWSTLAPKTTITMTKVMDELDELIEFLVDKRPPVRLHALQILLGLTGSPEGIERLRSKMDKLLVFALRLICDQVAEVSSTVLSVLVNLSQETDIAAKLLASNVVNRVMDYLTEGTCSQPRLLVMLLANLTVPEKGSMDLLQVGDAKKEGLHVAVLLKRFVMSGVTWEEGKDDTYEYVAPIITNLTRFKEARKVLAQPGRGTLQALAGQLRAPSLLRRQGASGALRNVCMSAEEDGTLGEVLSDPGVLSALLGPISGAAEGQGKEVDEHVRGACAEAIMVLASSTEGRKALWGVKGPELLQKGYELESVPAVCHALEHAAEFFLCNQTEHDEPLPGMAAEGAAAGKAEAAGEVAGSAGSWAQ